VHVCTVNSTGPNATTQVTSVSTPWSTPWSTPYSAPYSTHVSRVPPAALDPLAWMRSLIQYSTYYSIIHYNITAIGRDVPFDRSMRPSPAADGAASAFTS
jgi:hypothetical protein